MASAHHPRLSVDSIERPVGLKPLVIHLKPGETLSTCVSPRGDSIYRAGFVIKKGGRDIRFISVPFDVTLHPSVLQKVLERDQELYIRVKKD